MEKIKLVIFDGEGVIYNAKRTAKIFENEYEKFLKRFGTSLDEQGKFWFRLRPKVERGKISLRKANEIIHKKLGIPKSKVDEWLKKDKEICLKFSKLNKDAKRVLTTLKKKNLKIAILSDTVHPLRWKLALFKKFGLKKGKHYDKLFLSNEIGYAKPERKAYLTVINYFKVKPSETVFVGHDKEEIEGAKRAGIKTVGIEKESKADYIIKNLKELMKIIKVKDKKNK